VSFKYGAATEAAESLIAQIDSQNKLTTPIRKHRKIRHGNEIFKANEHAPKGVATSDLSNDTRNILKIFVIQSL
jgi:hypothetical protein